MGTVPTVPVSGSGFRFLGYSLSLSLSLYALPSILIRGRSLALKMALTGIVFTSIAARKLGLKSWEGLGRWKLASGCQGRPTTKMHAVALNAAGSIKQQCAN